jgi:hypothetical protein
MLVDRDALVLNVKRERGERCMVGHSLRVYFERDDPRPKSEYVRTL